MNFFIFFGWKNMKNIFNPLVFIHLLARFFFSLEGTIAWTLQLFYHLMYMYSYSERKKFDIFSTTSQQKILLIFSVYFGHSCKALISYYTKTCHASDKLLAAMVSLVFTKKPALKCKLFGFLRANQRIFSPDKWTN